MRRRSASPIEGKLVHSCADEYGPMEIVDEATVRSLHFGSSARQSTMFHHDHDALALVYTRCMMTCLLFGAEPRTALLLGLGGGSLPKFLRRHFPGCQLDGGELRPMVVELARRYFHFEEHSCTNVHITDAGRYLEKELPASLDLILVDIHNADGMAQAVGEPGFFAACHRLLRGRGTLVINLFSGDREGFFRRVTQGLEEVFEEQVLYLPVARKRNCIALAFCHPLSGGLLQSLPRRAAELGSRYGIEFPDLLRELQKANRVLYHLDASEAR